MAGLGAGRRGRDERDKDHPGLTTEGVSGSGCPRPAPPRPVPAAVPVPVPPLSLSRPLPPCAAAAARGRCCPAVAPPPPRELRCVRAGGGHTRGRGHRTRTEPCGRPGDSLVSNRGRVHPSAGHQPRPHLPPDTDLPKTCRNEICLKSPKTVRKQQQQWGQHGTRAAGPCSHPPLTPRNALMTPARTCCPQNRAAHPTAIQKSTAQRGCGFGARVPCCPSTVPMWKAKGDPTIRQAAVTLGQLLGTQVPRVPAQGPPRRTGGGSDQSRGLTPGAGSACLGD